MGYWDCTARDEAARAALEERDNAINKWKETKATYEEAVRIQGELTKTLEQATIMKDGYTDIKSSMVAAGDPISSSTNMEEIEAGCNCVDNYYTCLDETITSCNEAVEKWKTQLDTDEKDMEAKKRAYTAALTADCEWVSTAGDGDSEESQGDE